MIEWQNECSLFTIRIQGKQWYWVYKFDATASYAILAAPKNIGHNRWVVMTPEESYCSDSYYQTLHLGTQLEFKGLYYKYTSDDGLGQNSLNINTKHSNVEFLTRKNITKTYWPYLIGRIELYNEKYFPRIFFKKRYNKLNKLNKLNLEFLNFYTLQAHSLNSLFFKTLQSTNSKIASFKYAKAYYDFEQLDDLNNFAANITQQHSNKPLRFVKGLLNKHNMDLLKNVKVETNSYADTLSNLYRKKIKQLLKDLTSTPEYRKKKLSHKEMMRWYNRSENIKKIILEKRAKLFTKLKAKQTLEFGSIFSEKISETLKIFKNNLNSVILKNHYKLNKLIYFNILFQNNNKIVEKIEDCELFWGFRQRKYKRFKKYLFNKGCEYDSKTLLPLKKTNSRARILKNNLLQPFSNENDINNENYHLAIKYNKHRGELLPVNLARRLLRTKRTLVLPAHVNITLITNSYDVVHSWFVPGLGLKIDCVPGRSTHHSFYIDNVGFYYGQCAEICGRYHHHMPIRLCALNFEHFLVWWQKKGLRRMHRYNLLTDKTKKKNFFLHGQNGASMK